MIQIGLCIIEEGEIRETYSSYIKPSIDIPPFIQKLTGITEELVASAPTAEQILPEILQRLDGAVLVAHNIHFDLGVLQFYLEEHGYAPFKGTIIDTVELARILYPNRSGYRLLELAKDFQIKHESPHQADSDAIATANLFLILCEKMSRLPLVTIQRMVPITKSLFSDIEVLFRRLEHEKMTNPYTQKEGGFDEYRHLALKGKWEESFSSNPDQMDHIPSFGESYSIQDIKPSTLLQSHIERFEYRKGQDALTQEILHAFQEEEHGLFEAGTGTGKTLAYLLAAIYWAKTRQTKVVLSTYTIQLQDQIRDKEIPKLKEVMPFHFNDTLLKGRNHYLCLRKFEQSLYWHEAKNYDYDLTKLQFLVWLTETETGDSEELNLPSGGKEYWQKVQSETHSCLHHKCPWFERCFYFKARQKAKDADLIITNHSLLLSDLESQKLLPDYDYLILDEAHHLEHIATEQYGYSIHYQHLNFLHQRLYSEDKPTISFKLLEALELSEEGFTLTNQVEQVIKCLQEMKGLLDPLFTYLYALAENKLSHHTFDQRRTARIIHPEENSDDWLEIMEVATKLSELQMTIDRYVAQMEDWYQPKQKNLQHDLRSIFIDWLGAMKQFKEYIYQLERMLLHYDPEMVYWIEFEPKGARNSAGIYRLPLRVNEFLEESLFQKKKSVVLTSATLQVKHSFQYYIDQLGIPVDRVKFREFESPFNYERQTKLLVANDIKQSLQSDQSGLFEQEIANYIIEIAQVSKGRMMVLFTSYEMLRNTHQYLKEPLHENGIFLYAQGIDSGSRGKLTKNFESQERAILLGTSSFWEGIDIPGKQLSCLIIVKLPFTPPFTPYYEAKAEKIKEEGKNPFMDYALPQAVIRFKQGFGRLIRRADDTGVVVVFDHRIVSSRYGSYFIDSLPKLTVQSVNQKEMLQEIEKWLG